MSKEEFKNIISNFNAKDFGDYINGEYDGDEIEKILKKLNISIKFVDTITSAEENKAYVIVRVTNNGDISNFKFSGWYSSYDGMDIDYTEPIKVKRVDAHYYSWKEDNE